MKDIFMSPAKKIIKIIDLIHWEDDLEMRHLIIEMVLETIAQRGSSRETKKHL